ncbi:hypothetical protein BH23ACT9_BH23ACT9_35170 [soil metagenome]
MSRRTDIDRLALLLEDAPSAVEPTDDDRVLAHLAEALRAVPTDVPPMRAEFRAQLRAEVIDAARARQQTSSSPALLTRMREATQRFRYSSGLATGVSVSALALSGGGTALAAEHAQPDDALYGVKLALEDLRLTMTQDELARGQRAMAYSLDRLDEAVTAAADGRDGAAATALEGAAERTTRGSDLIIGTGLTEPMVELAGVHAEHVAILDQLQPLLGAEALAAAEDLRAVIIGSVEAIQAAVDPVDWPLPELPGLPVLSVPPPGAGPDATATPVPEITTPPMPVPGAPADGVPGTPGDPGSSGPLPGLTGPPSIPGLPGLPVPLPTSPITPTNPLPGVTDPLGEVLNGVGGAANGAVEGIGDGVEGLLEGVLDAVPTPLQSAVPPPVDGVVEQAPGVVGDVIDVIPGVVDAAPSVVDGALGAVLGGS